MMRFEATLQNCTRKGTGSIALEMTVANPSRTQVDELRKMCDSIIIAELTHVLEQPTATDFRFTHAPKTKKDTKPNKTKSK